MTPKQIRQHLIVELNDELRTMTAELPADYAVLAKVYSDYYVVGSFSGKVAEVRIWRKRGWRWANAGSSFPSEALSMHSPSLEEFRAATQKAKRWIEEGVLGVC